MHEIGDITSRIVVIRGQRALVDADLAELYGVTTRRLNEQVRRNPTRFPAEFCFPLSIHEVAILKSQFATSSWGGRRKAPLAFTEHGALMASAVLNTPRAVEVSIFVIRAFVRMREALAANREFARRLDELERKLGSHDRSIAHILDALRQLTAPPPEPQKRRRIGFVQD